MIEGGDASGRNSTKIGACVVSDLPENLPAKTAVEVEFKYLENGRLKVDANIPGTDVQATLEIERAAGLSEEKMEYWANWISEGAILTPVEDVVEEFEEIEQEDAAPPDKEIDFTDTEETAPFEPVEQVADEAEVEEGFDFSSFSEKDSKEDSEQVEEKGVESDGFFSADPESEDAGDGLEGLVTDESEPQGDVGTDDSGLADFLKDLQ